MKKRMKVCGFGFVLSGDRESPYSTVRASESPLVGLVLVKKATTKRLLTRERSGARSANPGGGRLQFMSLLAVPLNGSSLTLEQKLMI